MYFTDQNDILNLNFFSGGYLITYFSGCIDIRFSFQKSLNNSDVSVFCCLVKWCKSSLRKRVPTEVLFESSVKADFH